MAVYSSITNTEIAVDKPITKPLLVKYRENMVAQFEGAAGSPGVSYDAFQNVSPGNVDLDYMSMRAHTSSSWSWLDEWHVFKAGTYRITLRLYANNSGATIYARVYKNGVPFGTERSATANANAVFVEDLTFAVGDRIEIWSRNSSAVNAGEVVAAVSIAQPYYANIFCRNWFFIL